MRSICLHDNRSRKYDLSDSEKLLLLKFSGVPLEDLNKQNPGLLVFPREWGLYGDNWERECLFHIDGESIATGQKAIFPPLYAAKGFRYKSAEYADLTRQGAHLGFSLLPFSIFSEAGNKARHFSDLSCVSIQ